MRTGLVQDPLLLRHDTGPGHPERPERMGAVLRGLEGLPLLEVTSRDATAGELESAHDPAYLAWVRGSVGRGAGALDPDTPVCGESWAVAVRAAGAALALGEAWLSGRIEAGFACTRPPGHHACRARAMGFCLVNHVAVLARFLTARGKRMAIVDWDVHHGNGTQEIFWNDPTVLYASLHQMPLYPGTGAAHERGAGNIVNVPLPPGTDDAAYLAAFDAQVLPALEARAPDVVLVSCGFDAHARDRIAQLELTSGCYGELTRRLARWPLLSLLEGGYDLVALEESAREHLRALLEA
ncbi:MAG: histone deacetylase family protein [Planctomycetaceae bacterium]